MVGRLLSFWEGNLSMFKLRERVGKEKTWVTHPSQKSATVCKNSSRSLHNSSFGSVGWVFFQHLLTMVDEMISLHWLGFMVHTTPPGVLKHTAHSQHTSWKKKRPRERGSVGGGGFYHALQRQKAGSLAWFRRDFPQRFGVASSKVKMKPAGVHKTTTLGPQQPMEKWKVFIPKIGSKTP